MGGVSALSVISLRRDGISTTSTIPSCAGSELFVLVFEQNVERGERSVTARDGIVLVVLIPFLRKLITDKAETPPIEAATVA